MKDLHNMGVEPKIGGFYPPKWMVYFMENPYEQMDDFGGVQYPYFWKYPYLSCCFIFHFPQLTHQSLEKLCPTDQVH